MSTLQNAADVLRLFNSECTELTVSEVTARLGIPKANSSRLLKAMRETGMLETVGDTRFHRPGRLMLDLSVVFRKSVGIIGKANQAVSAITQQFGHTGYVTLRDGKEVTAVSDFEGSAVLRVVSNIGRRLPAELTATGHSLLARLSDHEIDELYQGYDRLAELNAALALVKENGFAHSSQMATPGVDSFAIAVKDPSTKEAVSLCIVFPHAVVSPEEKKMLLVALAKGATQIAQELNDKEFVQPKLDDERTYL